MGEVSAIIGRTFNALQRENVDIIAIAQGSSDCNVSFVVGRNDVKAGLLSTHREFQLGLMEPEEFPTK
jgi:aspartokinase